MRSTRTLRRALFLGSAAALASCNAPDEHVGVLSAADTTAPAILVDVGDEEALGPFASWKDVKADFGAKGDGTTDDTAALQKALKSLCVFGQTTPCNYDLYFPAGTYLITKTLSMRSNYGAALVGENPATTSIVWGGAANGIMLRTSGSQETLFTRLTWDGQGTAGIGVAQWWDTATDANYQRNLKHVDEVFQDLGFGIYGGRLGTGYGQGDSEVTIRRTKFLRASQAGVNVGSWNALDYWIWDSEFTDCARGVTNTFSFTGAWGSNTATPGAGNFMIYRSLFVGSTVADMEIGNTGWFSLHDNVSSGSKQFIHASAAGDNGAGIVVEGNRVIDTTDPSAIEIGNTGPLVLVDNQIRSAVGNEAGPVVLLDDFGADDRDVFSLGNSFTAQSAISTVPGDPGSQNRAIAIGNRTVARSAISATLPAAPTPAKNLHRPVIEVAPGATADQIQAAIDAATASTVVHLAGGTYELDHALTLPAETALVLTGDGLGATVLDWQPATAGPMIVLTGPSYATVRDLSLTASAATGITIGAPDQAGGRIFVNGAELNAPVSLSGLSQTRVLLQASGFVGLTASASLSVASVGGTLGNSPVTVDNGSQVFLSDHWFEGDSSRVFRGNSGTFTYVGGEIAPYSHGIGAGLSPSSPSVSVADFSGNVTFVIPSFNLVGDSVSAANGIRVTSATAATNALFLGASANRNDFFTEVGSGGAVGVVLSKGVDSAGHSTDLPDIGRDDSAFIVAGLAQMRGVVWRPAAFVRTAGATDVRLLRINVDTAQHGAAVALRAVQ